MQSVTIVNPYIICRTNDIVRAAIVQYRIDPGPHTKSGIYDAINKRRNARNYQQPAWMRAAWDHLQSLPSYADMTMAEKLTTIAACRPTE